MKLFQLNRQWLFAITIIISVISIVAFLLFDFPFLFFFLLFPPFLLRPRKAYIPITRCVNCQTQLDPYWKICPYCGKEIQLEVQSQE